MVREDATCCGACEGHYQAVGQATYIREENKPRNDHWGDNPIPCIHTLEAEVTRLRLENGDLRSRIAELEEKLGGCGGEGI